MTRAEYARQLKAHHICPRCKRQDSYTLAGRRYCAACAEKERQSAESWLDRPGNRERMNKSNMERYYARKRAGLCPQCGKPAEKGGHVTCDACLAKARAAYEGRKARK